MSKEQENKLFLEQKAFLIAKDIAEASLVQEIFARQIQSIQQCPWVSDSENKLEVLQKLHNHSQNVVSTLFKTLEETVTNLSVEPLAEIIKK
jgi:Zn-finger protein